jgi:hypothetical protein
LFHENGNFFFGGGRKKGKKNKDFYSKSPLLDVGGFAKQGLKNIRLVEHFICSPVIDPFHSVLQEEKKVIEEPCSVPVIRHDHDSDFKNSGTLGALSVDLSNIDKYEHLSISKLNQWDYPIFDLANDAQDTILSKVSK